jgi:hypothetical protein
MATNLTCKLLKQCVFYGWKAERKIALQELVLWAHLQLTILALSKVMKVWLQIRMELVCNVLIYHSVKKSHKHMLWCRNSSSDGATPLKPMKAWRMMIWVQTTMISCTVLWLHIIQPVHALKTFLRWRSNVNCWPCKTAYIFSVLDWFTSWFRFSFRKSHKQLM